MENIMGTITGHIVFISQLASLQSTILIKQSLRSTLPKPAWLSPKTIGEEQRVNT
jgi:hypothetical protein